MTVTSRLLVALLMEAVVILLAPAPATASEPESSAPTPVIERFLTIRDREVRTSLFSNGVVVVSARRGDEQLFFRQVTLDTDQFAGYLSAIERDASELAEADELPSATGSGGRGLVVIHADPSGPIRFSYSSLSVYDLATTRLLNILDDLEHHVMFGDPSGAGTEGWQPRVGDVVKLRSGGTAEVIDVRDDGTIVLEHESTYINELVPADRIRSVVYEVVSHSK